MPDFQIEDEYHQQGYRHIVGVDEVGRGPWAGPVVTCAVLIDRSVFPSELEQKLDDSKKVSEKKRALLEPTLKAHVQYAFGWATVAEIDQFNILQATFLAMQRAVDVLAQKQPVDFILVDGNKIPDWTYEACSVVKGDSKSLSIAAASILAKQERDRQMKALALQYPHYGWEKNAGYGTKKHQEGLAHFGVTPHHRKSFKPIAKLVA